jgi:hypothetical protein
MNLDAQIKCVRREIGLRKKVYPGLVARRTMYPEVAHHELKAMEAVLETLEGLAAKEGMALFPDDPAAEAKP